MRKEVNFDRLVTVTGFSWSLREVGDQVKVLAALKRVLETIVMKPVGNVFKIT